MTSNVAEFTVKRIETDVAQVAQYSQFKWHGSGAALAREQIKPLHIHIHQLILRRKKKLPILSCASRLLLPLSPYCSSKVYSHGNGAPVKWKMIRERERSG